MAINRQQMVKYCNQNPSSRQSHRTACLISNYIFTEENSYRGGMWRVQTTVLNTTTQFTGFIKSQKKLLYAIREQQNVLLCFYPPPSCETTNKWVKEFPLLKLFKCIIILVYLCCALTDSEELTALGFNFVSTWWEKIVTIPRLLTLFVQILLQLSKALCFCGFLWDLCFATFAPTRH